MSSPSALALAQSIELVMNEFFPPSSREQLGMNSLNRTVEASTSMGTESEYRDAIQFIIAPPKKNPESQYKVELGLIDAAMSLWMVSIDAKSP